MGVATRIRRLGSLRLLGGGVVLAVAWGMAAVGLPEAYQPVSRVLAELLAVILFVLSWRYRRGRLAVAAVVLAIANLLLRGPLAAQLDAGAGLELAALALLLPLNLGVLMLLRDRSVPTLGTAFHLVLVAAQPWLAAVVLRMVPPGSEGAGAWLKLACTQQASLLAFLIAAVFSVLALAMGRSAAEWNMLWALAAAAMALHAAGGVTEAAVMLAAAQSVLLLGVVEDAYRLAYHDQLTGLPGRRALDEAMRSLAGNYAVAMVDVDHFKRFNDRYGHDCGDQALRMVAECLRGVGGGGRAYRYGGEEFAILFTGVAMARVRDCLEQLRLNVAGRGFAIRGPKRPRKKPEQPQRRDSEVSRVKLTVSIGAAGPNARRPNPDEVLRAADRALYRAKGAGRNRLLTV